jgi:NADH:ubiquinone oxidoreductase subunit K
MARYSATILGIMRILAVMTVAGLGLLIVVFRKRDKQAVRRNLSQQGAD